MGSFISDDEVLHSQKAICRDLKENYYKLCTSFSQRIRFSDLIYFALYYEDFNPKTWGVYAFKSDQIFKIVKKLRALCLAYREELINLYDERQNSEDLSDLDSKLQFLLYNLRRTSDLDIKKNILDNFIFFNCQKLSKGSKYLKITEPLKQEIYFYLN